MMPRNLSESAREFEYRPAEFHALGQLARRAVRAANYFLVAIAIAAAIAGEYLPNRAQNPTHETHSGAVTQEADRARTPSLIGEAGSQDEHNGTLFFLASIILGLVGLNVVRDLARQTLKLDDLGLSYTLHLPLGLDRLFRRGWRIEWKEIAQVDLILPATTRTDPNLALTELRLRRHTGSSQVIQPAMWFVPGSPARPRLRPVAKGGWFEGVGTTWSRPENLAALRDALRALPLLEALTARGFAINDARAIPSALEKDIFVFPSIKFGMLGGFILIVTGLALMILRPHQHLVMDFPVTALALLGVLMASVQLALSLRDSKNPPWLYRILAAAILATGATVAAPVGITALNGLGVPSTRQENFVVRSGRLEPVDENAPTGAIELPGSESRMAFLREGTRVSLALTRGRFGLWEYDDTPLRDQADAQGIR